ncbi:MAG TPA: hypothetical protein VGI99_02165 [Gemmataceae bacterium]|jgi:hypothetical protein
MEHPLIHDRGRGPELVGTRTTIYNLVPYFLQSHWTEAAIAEANRIAPEQVAAMRAYLLANHADVMMQHERIEERIRKGYEAQNTPEFRAKCEESRKVFEHYKLWLKEGSPETKNADREARFGAFRNWYANRAMLVEPHIVNG